MLGIISKAADKIYEAVYPKLCAACGRYGSNICAECLLELTLVRAYSCPGCGRASRLGRVCVNCRRKLALDGLIPAVRPEFVIKKAVHAFKYKNVTDLSVELGAILVYAVKKSAIMFDYVVPVPVSRERIKEKGYDQTYLLAQEISEQLDLPILTALKKIKDTHRQVGLDRSARLSNLSSAFAITKKKKEDPKILLVDDVATTCTTLNECAKVLKYAGATSVVGAVLYRD